MTSWKQKNTKQKTCFFPSVRGTDLLSRVVPSENGKTRFFFSSVKGTSLLLMEARICFRERHIYAFFEKVNMLMV